MASGKPFRVLTLTAQTTFTEFESLTLIDAGAADGFQIAGPDDNFGVIPTGIVVNIGGPGPRLCQECTVKAASGKSLNVTAIIYD